MVTSSVESLGLADLPCSAGLENCRLKLEAKGTLSYSLCLRYWELVTAGRAVLALGEIVDGLE